MKKLFVIFAMLLCMLNLTGCPWTKTFCDKPGKWSCECLSIEFYWGVLDESGNSMYGSMVVNHENFNFDWGCNNAGSRLDFYKINLNKESVDYPDDILLEFTTKFIDDDTVEATIIRDNLNTGYLNKTIILKRHDLPKE